MAPPTTHDPAANGLATIPSATALEDPAPAVVDVEGGGGDAYHDETSSAASSSMGHQMASCVREYCLSCLPPHIRRKGLGIPPVESIGRKILNLVTLPYFPWATMNWKKYPELAPHDFIAGLTVGIMLVPQGMAYALLSSLPPIYGLYTSTIAGYVYTLFGTSGQLTIGPVALVSLFMSETFNSLGVPLTLKDKDPTLNAQAKYHTYVRTELAAVASLAVAIMLMGMAFLRIGRLMKFISPSVLTGFVTGSAVYIFINQSKYIWGFKVPRDTVQWHEFRYLFNHLKHADRYAMGIGLTSFAALVLCNSLRKSVVKPSVDKIRARGQTALANLYTILANSATLVIIIIATCVTAGIVKNGHHLDIIGDVPAGFNTFQFPAVFNNFYGEGIPFGKVIICCIPLTFLTYLESVSVGRKYALVHKYALDMTQELWALGFGCLFASFFQSYPIGGSFSRTALKNEVGVKTPFANVVTSLFVTLILVCATKLLKYVPNAVLGAVICSAVMSLTDFHDMWRALWVAPVDFLVMMFTFLVTVFWNVELGLEYGILASVAILLIQISKLDMDSIGQLSYADEETTLLSRKAGTHFRPLDNYPAARQHPKVKVLRLRANLFFGNISVFRDEFYASIVENEHPVKAVIIDAAGVVEMDLASLAVIDEMVTEMNKQKVEVYFASANPRIVKNLEAYDLLEDVGGLPLVQLEVEDVFWAVLEDLDMEEAAALGVKRQRSRSNSASIALAERRAGGGSSRLAEEGKAGDPSVPLARKVEQ